MIAQVKILSSCRYAMHDKVMNFIKKRIWHADHTTIKISNQNREHFAWYMYDFGNSANAAVVLLAVYSAYFKGTVVGGAEGTRQWGIAVGIAMLVSAVVSPILGTITNFAGSKKKFLLYYSVVTWVFIALRFLWTRVIFSPG